MFWRAVENEIADASDFVSAVKMKPLANEQKGLFTGEKSFSCSRNVLIGRVFREYSEAQGRLLPEVVVHTNEIK